MLALLSGYSHDVDVATRAENLGLEAVHLLRLPDNILVHDVLGRSWYVFESGILVRRRLRPHGATLVGGAKVQDVADLRGLSRDEGKIKQFLLAELNDPVAVANDVLAIEFSGRRVREADHDLEIPLAQHLAVERRLLVPKRNSIVVELHRIDSENGARVD